AVEEAVAEITQKVGAVIAEMNSLVQHSIAKAKELASWAATQVNDLLVQPAIAAAQSLISSLNSAFNSVQEAITAVTNEIAKITNQMLESLQDFSIRECSSLSEAVSEVPSGSGIESISRSQGDSD